MASYPYLNNTGSIKSFFGHIQDAGVPGTINQQYLTSVGFKSSNDRPLITLAKFLGFVDTKNAPTQLWKNYRNRAQARDLMGAAIKNAYEALFQTYPDANRRDDEALRDFFSAAMPVGKVAIDATIRTFKLVCELAEFGAHQGDGPNESPVQETPVPMAPPKYSRLPQSADLPYI